MSVTYKGLQGATDAEVPHLGGSIKVGDPYTYCPKVWDYVVSRFGVESVLDIGSGSGNASQYFFRMGLKTVAVDGFESSVNTSIYPSVMLDLTKGSIKTKVDLVYCQEVAEHIEERFVGNLLDSFLCGRIILMTHALPEQYGYHHVNLQPMDYWVDHMARRGCDYLEADSMRIRALAEQDGAPYMQNSGLVFANGSRL